MSSSLDQYFHYSYYNHVVISGTGLDSWYEGRSVGNRVTQKWVGRSRPKCQGKHVHSFGPEFFKDTEEILVCRLPRGSTVSLNPGGRQYDHTPTERRGVEGTPQGVVSMVVSSPPRNGRLGVPP